MYTGVWVGGWGATLGGSDLKAVKPRQQGDIVIFMALLSRGGMRVPWLRVSAAFCRADPYSPHDLHVL
jgi:hypothetical protein